MASAEKARNHAQRATQELYGEHGDLVIAKNATAKSEAIISPRQSAERLAANLGVPIMVHDRGITVDAPPGYVWGTGERRLAVGCDDMDQIWSILLEQMRDGLRKSESGESPRHPR